MATQRMAVNQRFRDPHNAIAELAGFCGFSGVSFLDMRRRVPITAIALYEKVKGRDVQIKDHLANGKFRDCNNTLFCQRFANLTLYGCFALTPAVATKRAKAAPSLCLRGRSPEFGSTRFTRLEYRRLARALNRAIPIARGIRGRYAKNFPTFFAGLSNLAGSAFWRTVKTRFSPALVKREFPAAFFTSQWGISSAAPRLTSRARATARAIKRLARGSFLFFPTIYTQHGWKRLGLGTRLSIAGAFPEVPSSTRTATTPPRRFFRYPFFSAVRTGVNVIFSHGVNLIHRLAFWSEPQGCISTFAARLF